MKRSILLFFIAASLVCMTACEKDPAAGTTVQTEGNTLSSNPAGTMAQPSDGDTDPTEPGAEQTEPKQPADGNTNSGESNGSANPSAPSGATDSTAPNGSTNSTTPNGSTDSTTPNGSADPTAPDATAGTAEEHNFTNGKCINCGQAQENYQPLHTGSWQAYAMDKTGRLLNINLFFRDDLKMFDCAYGAELSTLDPNFQADLLANPSSLVDFEGKKYYFGSGDGGDAAVNGDDNGGSMQILNYATQQVYATIHFQRISGNQLKILRTEGNVFGLEAVLQDLILTWNAN